MKSRLEITWDIQFNCNMKDILEPGRYISQREKCHAFPKKVLRLLENFTFRVTMIYPNTIYPDDTQICILYIPFDTYHMLRKYSIDSAQYVQRAILLIFSTRKKTNDAIALYIRL